MTHELKCWPEPFRQIVDGRKRHEIRKADRPFMEDDLVRLREWIPDNKEGGGYYTGRERVFVIGHITRPGEWGLSGELCVFSLLKECRP